MVIVLFGESCTGKSSVAEALKAALSAAVYTGKDYFRFDKTEEGARTAFRAYLAESAVSRESVVYVVTEKEQLSLVPDSCFRVLMTAELPVIRERFARRMHGQLPPPVTAMLERKHGMFDREPHELCFDSGSMTADAISAAILSACATQGYLQ